MAKDLMDELAASFTELNKGFEEFKSTNDERLKEIETKNAADVLLEEKLTKINEDMDKQQKLLDDMAAAETRQSSVEIDGKSVPIEELDHKASIWARSIAREMEIEPPAEYKYEDLQVYSKAFDRYLRKDQAVLTPDEQKALSVGSGPDGGYLVTPDSSGRMIKRIFETSPMRSYANIQTIAKDSLEGLYDVDEASFGWVGETEGRPNTNTPKVERWSIPVHEMYAMPQATQKLLDDADVDMEAWLEGKVSSKFGRAEAAAFVNGNGVNQPRGFLTYDNVTTPGAFELGRIERFSTGVNGAFAATPDSGDVLLDMIYGMKNEYRAGAIFAMSRMTQGGVRKLKDSDGNYLWAPGIVAGQPSSLLGYSVAQFDDMPDFTTAGALGIAFGNFGEAYQIVDRHGIRTLRDPYVNKPYVQFYSIKRVGGAVVNFDAMRLLSFAA